MSLNYSALDNAKIEFKSPIYIKKGKKKKKVGEKVQTVYTKDGQRLEKAPTNTEGVTFIEPPRDESGKTALDLRVEKNKAKSERIKTVSALVDLQTGREFRGGVEQRGNKSVFVGFYQPSEQEKKASAAIIDARKKGFLGIADEAAKDYNKKRLGTLGENLSLKMALPVATLFTPLNTEKMRFSVVETTIPRKETALTKALTFASTPITETASKNKFLKTTIDKFTYIPKLALATQAAKGSQLAKSDNKFLSMFGKGYKFQAETSYKVVFQEALKPSTWAFAYGGNLLFKGIGAGLGSKAVSKLPLGKFAIPAFNFAGKAAAGGYVTFQALDVVFKKKTASTAAAETFTTFAAFKLTEPAAQATFKAASSLASSGAIKIRDFYNTRQFNKLYNSQFDRGLVNAFGKNAASWGGAKYPNLQTKGQLNLFNRPANMALNEPVNPSNPLQTREGYLKYGGKYLTNNFGNRVEISSLMPEFSLKDVGQTTLFKNRMKWRPNVFAKPLESGAFALYQTKSPYFTASPKYTKLAPIGKNDFSFFAKPPKQSDLINFGFTEISYKPKNLGFTNINTFMAGLGGKSKGFNLIKPLAFAKETGGVKFSLNAPRANTIAETKTAPSFVRTSGFAKSSKYNLLSFPEYTGQTPKGPLLTAKGITREQPLGFMPDIRGGYKERLTRKLFSIPAPPKFKGDTLKASLTSEKGDLKPVSFGDTAIKELTITEGRSASRSRSRSLIQYKQDVALLTEPARQFAGAAFNRPNFSFGKLKFGLEIPKPLKPNFTFNLFRPASKGQRGDFSFFNIRQPKAFKVSVRSAFLGLKGETPRGNILTGLGERFIPKKFKFGAI